MLWRRFVKSFIRTSPPLWPDCWIFTVYVTVTWCCLIDAAIPITSCHLMHQACKTLIIKNLIIYSALLFSPLIAIGQIDYNQIVAPEGTRPTSFEDYLVQLAWMNSPQTKILEYEKSKEQKEVEIQKQDWMDDVRFGFNINEVSLANVLESRENKANNLVLYPLYQLSATVSLGTFTTNKKKKEFEQYDVLIAEMEGNQHKLTIRAETLARYRKLLLAIETLKLRTKAEEDARNTYQIAQQRFKNAELDMEEMLRASESFNNAQEKRLSAETEIELAILEIEEMIGIKWEIARKAEERYNKKKD